MKHLLTLLLLFISIFVFSQQTENSNIILGYSQQQDLYFYEYQPRLKIKAFLKKQSQAKNEYPEELVQSVLSARTQEWVNYNTLGGETKASQKDDTHFKRVKKMNKDKNYFELHHKLIFKIDGVETAIIKFFLIQENEQPISGAMFMQKINNRWYVTSRSDMSMFVILIMRIKSEVLEGALFGNSKNIEITNLYKKISSENGIDLKAFEKEFFDWYLPENSSKKELFIDPKTW